MGVNKAVGWFSSAERWFQTRHSIESYRKFHGDSVDYYILFCSPASRLDGIDIPDYVKAVLPNQMASRYATGLGGRYKLFESYSRPLIVDYMLSQGYETVQCLDGDMETFGSFGDLWKVLETHNAFVTPHRIYPPPRDGKVMCLEQFALCGNYNSGFTGFRNTQETRRFIDWWIDITLDAPECNMSAGRFAEQGWLRFIADYLDDVHICRDQGVNFAFWRYDNHEQFREDGKCGWTVDGVPLRLFHYGALDFDNLQRVAVHHNRCTACPDLLKFFQRYKSIVLPD